MTDEERNTEYVAMIPAGGWRIGYKQPDGTWWSEPLIGWALTRSGVGEALTCEGTALVMAGDHPGDSRNYYIYHPDADRDLPKHTHRDPTTGRAVER